MKRRSIAALALIAAVALSSCAGKKISDIDAPVASNAPQTGATWIVPDGVVVTPAQRGASEVAGLYPSTVPNDRRCCWLATDASVVVIAPRAPTTLHVDVLVPDYPFFETTPQELTLKFGTRTANTGPLAPGVHRLQFDDILSASPDGRLRVTIHALHTFIPARERVNADTRSLGIILLRIAFR